MTQIVLKTKSLSKRYQHFYALKNISITLKAGRIYGLIGQNGAGKSTLMRLITGLSFPTQGQLSLFGQSGQNKLTEERRRLGAMIEYPGFIPYMSASENLKAHRLSLGIPNEEKDHRLLEFVGLSAAGSKKAGKFSLGIKQRLGIALALVNNPEFLVLDEPVNGLDPAGVVEIRKLLQKLCAEQGMTILISSHNLPELYQTATDYLIIHKGEIIQTMDHDQLQEKCDHYIKIQCADTEKLVTVLQTDLHVSRFQVMPDRSVRLYELTDERELVSQTLYNRKLIPYHFSIEGETLEDYFLTLTGGGRND